MNADCTMTGSFRNLGQIQGVAPCTLCGSTTQRPRYRVLPDLTIEISCNYSRCEANKHIPQVCWCPIDKWNEMGYSKDKQDYQAAYVSSLPPLLRLRHEYPPPKMC